METKLPFGWILHAWNGHDYVDNGNYYRYRRLRDAREESIRSLVNKLGGITMGGYPPKLPNNVSGRARQCGKDNVTTCWVGANRFGSIKDLVGAAESVHKEISHIKQEGEVLYRKELGDLVLPTIFVPVTENYINKLYIISH